MRAATVALLFLFVWQRPALAQRSDDEMRQKFAQLSQTYQDIQRQHPEIYSHYPVVELITMGVGGLIWERHGHIALCVHKSPMEEDCYNYGIGDFHHPLGMATGFFRGTHSFWVGKMDPGQMFATYLFADRTIWVQPLPLTDEQEKQVIDKLEYDIQEDHKAYAYDHFWDNCTTRVRDVLDNATGGVLKKLQGPPDDRTYRDLARKGFFGMRIPLLITDLAMGRVTDRVPSYWEKMFLPDYLREAAEKAWGIKPIAIYERQGPPPLDNGPSGRVLFALVILLLTAPAWITRLLGKGERAGVAVAVLPYVILGIVFWFLAIVSPLPYVRWNESCLVFLPTDLMLVWFLSPERRRRYARGRVIMIGLLAALLVVNVLHQPLWAALLWPLIPALVVGFWPPRAKAAEPVAVPATAKSPQKSSKKR